MSGIRLVISDVKLPACSFTPSLVLSWSIFGSENVDQQ